MAQSSQELLQRGR